MSIHIFVLCSWAEFTQGEAAAKAVSEWELLTHASGDDSSSGASTADFLGLPRGTQALQGNGPGEGPVKFLLIVDQAQSFSVTGNLPSKGSEVRKLIASHKTISTACVDLFLPCGYLIHRVTVHSSELNDVV